MIYNLTNITDANSFIDITKAINDITGGYFSAFLLFSLLIIGFIVLKGRYDTRIVILANSFVCTLISLALWGMGWLSTMLLLWPILLTLGAIVYYLFSKE